MPTKKTQWSNDIQAFTAQVGDSNPHGFKASTKSNLKIADWKIWTDSRRPGTSLQSSRPSISRAHVAIMIAMFKATLFSNGDLVLKKVHKCNSKLSPIWDGPYIISEMTRLGAYRLKHEYQLSVHIPPLINFVLLTPCSLGNPTKQRVGGYNSYTCLFCFLSKTIKSTRVVHVPSSETLLH